MLAIEKTDASRSQLRQARANSDQVGVHQFDQRSAHQKVEADKREQCRRVVEHPTGGFLYAAALFDEIGL